MATWRLSWKSPNWGKGVPVSDSWFSHLRAVDFVKWLVSLFSFSFLFSETSYRPATDRHDLIRRICVPPRVHINSWWYWILVMNKHKRTKNIRKEKGDFQVSIALGKTRVWCVIICAGTPGISKQHDINFVPRLGNATKPRSRFMS